MRQNSGVQLVLPLAFALTFAQGFAPASRNVKPQGIFSASQSATARSDLSSVAYTLVGPNASVTYDFGQEVAGLASLHYYAGHISDAASSSSLPSHYCNGTCQGLAISFSESVDGIGPESDTSTALIVTSEIFSTSAKDGFLYLPLLDNQSYELPAKWSRGGFRYLTLSLGATSSPSTNVTVEVENVYYNAAPNLGDYPNQYTGFFNSSDPLLNDIWYAGAYTLQLNTIQANSCVNHGTDALQGWSQDSTASNLTGADLLLTDGAKRDRTPWPGDSSVALKSALVAQNYDSILAVHNSLKECIIVQNVNASTSSFGYFPYAGSPLGNLMTYFPSIAYGSDTYHLYVIEVFGEYVLATNDTSFLQAYWSQINEGIKATYQFVGCSGLFDGTRNLDWGRAGQGGNNSALNALYHGTLNQMIVLAQTYPTLTPGATVDKWSTMAQKLKTAFNNQLWDATANLYKDNTSPSGATLYPQDGNAFAVEYNLTNSTTRSRQVMKALAARLTDTGASSPELNGSVSPFIGSHELIAQFKVAESTGDPSSALALIRKQWGFMRRAFSNTTFIEGYALNGTLAYGFSGGDVTEPSHAHAWSTGPVYSLMHDVVGIHGVRGDVDPADGEWAMKPLGAMSDLEYATGSVQYPIGNISASWQKFASNGTFRIAFSTPSQTNGTLYMPLFGQAVTAVSVTLNNTNVTNVSTIGPFVRIANLPGGQTVATLRNVSSTTGSGSRSSAIMSHHLDLALLLALAIGCIFLTSCM